MRSTYLLGTVLLALAVAFTGLGCDDGESGPDCEAVANACVTLGAVQCNTDSTGTERCAEDADGCAVWTTYETCAGSQTCEAGLCRCENACATAGDTQCNGAIVQTCTADNLGCLAWDDTTDCATNGQICEDATGTAACADTCTDACDTVNATQCTGNTVETCQLGVDGCNDWVVTDTCEANEACQVTGADAACVVTCTPDCTGRECGSDGCTGSCGDCGVDEQCNVDGVCEPVCVPDCTGLECGDDGCGGSCGDCTAPEVCILASGLCEDCAPDCTARECGVDPVCGASCGDCGVNEQCDVDGICQPICTPVCTGLECGDDGCGGSCGACTAPEVCILATGQCEDCTPDCTGLECGPDPVCGASCGACTAPETCNAGQCECVPNCTGLECGDDGCGGSCGECTAPETCNAGQCECVPNCTGLECGDDGCGGSCGECTAPETCDANGQCVGGGSCTELVTDGGFEAGAGSGAWTEASTQFGTPLCDLDTCNNSFPPHAGNVWAWFGGVESGVEDGSLSQSVTIPAGQPATLFFFLWSFADGSGTAGYLDVTVDGTQVFHTTEADVDSYAAWTLVQIDLSAYADGAAHDLAFVSNVQGAGISFLVDDVSLGSGAACCIGECTVGDPNVCQGDSVFACVADAGGCGVWTLNEDCAAAGELCLNGACVTCVNNCDTEGATQCAGSVIQTCSLGGNGCLDWVDGTDCAATGDLCIAGACVTVSCTDIASNVGAAVATGSNTGMANTFTPVCQGNSGADVCFTWTAPADGTYLFNTNTSSYDTVIMVLDATGAQVACDDDSGDGLQSMTSYAVTAGAVYTLVIDAYSTGTGTYVLNIQQPECTPDELRCMDAMTLQICNASGLWGDTYTCIIGCDDTLDPPNCTTICEPGATQCNADGVTLETCGQTGEEWVPTTCPNGCEDLGDTARCILNCTDIASAVGTPATTGDLTGAPAVSDLPCFAGNPPSGPEVCFLWTAPTTGSYMFDTLNSSPVDDTVLGVYDAAGTLLGCNDDEANSYLSVTGAPTVAGAEYTIVVDSWPGQTGAFNLNINELLPESACDDMADNDMDNYIDCADDTACAGTASCTPGAGILAAACTVPSDCASNAGADPFCFPDAWGFTNGNCSEWCDIAAQDCAAGGVCAQLYMGGVPLAEGLCLIACDGGTVCPTGLTCDLEYGFCFL